MQLLESDSEYRQHLKIGDTFASFMDFSKYFFLSHIIGNIHDPTAGISKSIAENASIIWDSAAFEAKYGSKNTQIHDRLQPLYASFENSVRTVLQRNHVDSSIQEFQLKNWFLRCLSGGDPAAPDLDAHTGVTAELNDLAKKMLIDTISTAQKRLMKAVNNIIESQSVFTSDKLKRNLLSATFTKINRLKAEFKSKKGAPDSQLEQKKQALLVIEELAHLKRQSAHLTSVLDLLNKSVPEISSYDLLKVMFNIVLIHMYQEPWGMIAPAQFNY
jgi:hypothetical protein